jgi:hypothetical protein
LSSFYFATLGPSLGSGALLAVIVGTIELANEGLLTGRGSLSILNIMANLAFFGAIAGFAGLMGSLKVLEPIRKVWIHDEAVVASRLSMMRIMARRTKAATVPA